MGHHIDQEDLMKRAGELKDAVAVGAIKALDTASDLTRSGVETAKPKVLHAAKETIKMATPMLDSAGAQAVKLTESATEKLGRFHQDMLDDYLPRINQAVEDAAAKASGVPMKAETTIAAVEKQPKKRHRGRKFVKWTLIGAGIAGIGYLLWRRSQPIEDPWAEEYWSDLDSADDQAETLPEKVTDKVADTVSDVADKVADKVEKKTDDK